MFVFVASKLKELSGDLLVSTKSVSTKKLTTNASHPPLAAGGPRGRRPRSGGASDQRGRRRVDADELHASSISALRPSLQLTSLPTALTDPGMATMEVSPMMLFSAGIRVAAAGGILAESG
jgi:hypothetical protein